MQAVAHNKAFAKKVGVPQSVGKEFTMKKATKYGNAMVKKSADTKGRAMKKYADGGAAPDRYAIAQEMFNRMKDAPKRSGPRVAPAVAAPAVRQAASPAMAKKGGTVKKMAKGGLAAGHKAADGCATKGKTKGKEIKMAKGGYMKGGSC